MPKPISRTRVGTLQSKIKQRYVRGCGEQQIAYNVEVLNVLARWAAEVALQELARGGLAPEPVADPVPQPPPLVPELPLGMTPELLDLLELVAENRTDQHIARRLHLTVWQVKRRLGLLYTALDAQGRLAAVAAGYELGFLGPASRRARKAAARALAASGAPGGTSPGPAAPRAATGAPEGFEASGGAA